MKRIIVAILLLAILFVIPVHGLSEDKGTVLLARVIYTIARDMDYDAKVALGSVIMNRVNSPWYPDTLSGVLNEKQQFPAGSEYDDESLKAAHAVVSGSRSIDSKYLNWSTDPVEDALNIDGMYVYTR